MLPDALNQPVVTLMRPSVSLAAESSLERAAGMLRDSHHRLVPVQRGGELLGVVTERTLADALARGCNPHDPVTEAVTNDFGKLDKYETGAAALRHFSDGGFDTLLVTDSNQAVLGFITASDLYPKPPRVVKPPMVGGMATPFGVYLTNGAFGAGVPWWALASTGAVMFALVAIGGFLQDPLMHLIWRMGFRGNADVYANIMPLITLFVGMRLLPLAGIHAAEHKVVHAIEQGEPLVPEVVDRMSRVHPRCGTNIWAGSMIFFGCLSLPIDIYYKGLLAIVATLMFWRPVGYATQWLFTTRPPNRKQLEMGIKSGKELLEKYRLARNPPPTVLQRIWASGIAYVMAGFGVCYGIASGIAWLFHYQLPF